MKEIYVLVLIAFNIVLDALAGIVKQEMKRIKIAVKGKTAILRADDLTVYIKYSRRSADKLS